MSSNTERLLSRVSRRLLLASFGKRCQLFCLITAGIYTVVLLCSRLLAIVPDVFVPRTILVVPLLGAILAAIFHRRSGARAAARLSDVHANTDDLLLTATLLSEQSGEFTPLVIEQAERKSGEIDPAGVVVLDWLPGLRNVALALGVALLCVLFLPQLDPFGRHEERVKRDEEQKRLQESVAATALRKKTLAQKEPGKENTDEVKQTIDELKKTFNQMKPKDPKTNLQRLSDRQKELGKLWRKVSEDKLRNALNRMPSSQHFGGGDVEKLSRWKRQLQKGDPSGIKQELDEVKKLAAEAAEESDPGRRDALRRQMSSRLKGLNEFMSGATGSKTMDSALKRALEQLAMSEKKELSEEASKALQQSLDLAGMEAANLAQGVRDLQALEDALRAAQLAKQANAGNQGLDGEQCADCGGIPDYADLFEQMMAQGKGEGEGFGPGMGGPGMGKGGKADEDDTQETVFKPERSQSALLAGKLLLQWKTQDLSKPGAVRQDYRDNLQNVKQGVSEAILHEQIPPGYHESIRKYFDTIDEAN